MAHFVFPLYHVTLERPLIYAVLQNRLRDAHALAAQLVDMGVKEPGEHWQISEPERSIIGAFLEHEVASRTAADKLAAAYGAFMASTQTYGLSDALKMYAPSEPDSADRRKDSTGPCEANGGCLYVATQKGIAE